MSSNIRPLPEWLKVGAIAVVVSDENNYLSGPSVKPVTIAKILKRDIVLDGASQRFRVADRHDDTSFQIRTGSTWNFGHYYLMPPDHPKAVAAGERMLYMRRLDALSRALKQSLRAPSEELRAAVADMALFLKEH